MTTAAWHSSLLRLVLVLVVCAVTSLAARAQDTVVLKRGVTMDGRIVEENDEVVVLKMSTGTVTLQKKEIERIIRRSRPEKPRPPKDEPKSPVPPADRSAAATPIPPPVAGRPDIECFREGMLNPGQEALVDIFALDEIPEAFLGGHYQVIARCSGPGPTPNGFDGWSLVELGWEVYGFSHREPAKLVFLVPEAMEPQVIAARDKWVRLRFTLARRNWESPSYGTTFLYVAEVTSLAVEEGLDLLEVQVKGIEARIGQEMRSILWARKFGGEVAGSSPPGVEVWAEGVTKEHLQVVVAPDAADLLARHPHGLIAKLRVAAGSPPAAQGVELTPLYPFNDPAAALTWHRLHPAGAPDLFTGDWERVAASVKESIQRHGEVPAHAFDLREPEQVSRTAGTGPRGEVVTVSSGDDFREGFVWFEGGQAHEVKTMEELKACAPRPRIVYHRCLGGMKTSTGPGEVVGPSGTTPTTLVSAFLTPLFRRLVLDEARGEWAPVDLGPTLKRAAEIVAALKVQGTSHRDGRYELRDLEGKVQSLEARLQWLTQMIDRSSTGAAAREKMRGEKEAKEKELAEKKRQLAELQGDQGQKGQDVDALKRELLAYWRGERVL